MGTLQDVLHVFYRVYSDLVAGVCEFWKIIVESGHLDHNLQKQELIQQIYNFLLVQVSISFIITIFSILTARIF